MDLVAALLTWVAAYMCVGVPPAPMVTLIGSQELQIKAYGAVPTEPGFTLLALYDRQNGIIYLRDTFDEHNVIHRSHLVHELVHHLQNVNGVTGSCRGDLERDAYQAQFAWLRMHGFVDPFAVLEINQLTYGLITACRDSDD